MSSESFNTAFDIAFCDRYNGHKKSFSQFNPQWLNGTGYLDGAVDDRSIGTHPVVALDPKGRRVIIIPLDNGNLVFFDRYAEHNGIIIAQGLKPDGTMDAFHVTPTEVSAPDAPEHRIDFELALFDLNNA